MSLPRPEPTAGTGSSRDAGGLPSAGMTGRSRRGGSVRRWLGAPLAGMYRCVVVAGLTAPLAVVAGAVGYFGISFTLSWSARLSAPVSVQALAIAGEVALGLWWTFLAGGLAALLAARPASQATRGLVKRWLGISIEARYQPEPSVTRMSTGFWWNGYGYQRSESAARRQAQLMARRRDPQWSRDQRWLVVASLTVLPAAALPPLALASGIYLAAAAGLAAWGAGLVVASLAVAPLSWRLIGLLAPRLLGPPPSARVRELESIRADLTQSQAAELERIERALHDGAQARLVALGMAMSTAERLIDEDPEAAKALLAEARASSAAALEDLRALARGINPPVLAERGLVDAIRALAMDAPMEVTVTSTLSDRPERPLESAVYFALCELLANAAKHSHATRAAVELGLVAKGRGEHELTATVADNGAGGAAPGAGSGLPGIERRMAAFGGRLEIDSPAGGPTRITVAVPCASS
jgi:signal transduction histidine kinase